MFKVNDLRPLQTKYKLGPNFNPGPSLRCAVTVWVYCNTRTNHYVALMHGVIISRLVFYSDTRGRFRTT